MLRYVHSALRDRKKTQKRSKDDQKIMNSDEVKRYQETSNSSNGSLSHL